ncbi:MAG: arginine deiminase, partial [Rhodothermales bacterium]|nr:arginine deiminase [Rhodothermales bacterium]
MPPQSPEADQSSSAATPSTSELSLEVTSETGRLRRVIVHTPGPEMEMVSPESLGDLLFEDILFLGKARSEHERMCRLFRKIVGREDAVLQIRD